MTSINFTNSLKEAFPINPEYFKEEILSQTYILDDCYSDIDELVDFVGTIEIENYNLKHENVGVSTEGKYMSGKKIIAAIKLKGKLTYNATCLKDGVSVIFFEFTKNVIIVIPEKIKNDYTCDLIRAKRFTITPYIEDLHCRKIDLRRIHISAMLFVDFKFC